MRHRVIVSSGDLESVWTLGRGRGIQIENSDGGQWKEKRKAATGG